MKDPEKIPAEVADLKQDQARQALLEQFKHLKVGDVIVSKSGTGRIVREVVVDANGKAERYDFDRVALSQERGKDTRTMIQLIVDAAAVYGIVPETTFDQASRIFEETMKRYADVSFRVAKDEIFLSILGALQKGHTSAEVLKKFIEPKNAW